jgi:ribosomal protein S12 methylthiotransferase accessory factor
MVIDNFYRIVPGYSLHVIDKEKAVLLHESHSQSILGELYVSVLAEIALGTTSLFSRSAVNFDTAELMYAIRILSDYGYIIESDKESDCRQWNAFPHSDEIAGLLKKTISFSGTLPEVDMRKIIQTFRSAGFKNIQEIQDSAINVVICRDYLEPEIAQLQNLAFNNGVVYCFPVKLTGRVLFLGPLIKKGQQPCWNCLLMALKKNRPIENYLSRLSGSTILPENQLQSLTLHTGIHSAIIHLMKKMKADSYADSELVTFDTWDQKIERHHIRIQPQCECCGQCDIFSTMVKKPIVINDIPRPFNTIGGYRTISPESTWENYKHLVSPITGIVSHIGPYDKKNHTMRPVWKATYFVNPPAAFADRNEPFVRNSFGKGHTAAQSRASALCEAIERYAFCWTGEEPVIRKSYNELKHEAINPIELQFFSEQQLSQNNSVYIKKSPQWIPLPFDPDKELSWTPAWSLTENKLKYVPLQYCYSMVPTVAEEQMFPFSSNGNAAGNCIEEAIVQGILELVERDATAIWWYNRIKRPQVYLDNFNDTYFNEIYKHYMELGWDLWVLDVTHDLGIPSVVALAKNKKNGHFTIGFGAHLSMYIAVQRAITEMHQTFDPQGNHDPVWKEHEIEQTDFLYPDNNTTTQSDTHVVNKNISLKDDIFDCVERIKNNGMEMVILNYTRPDIGVPTVKVIVPGLRHFWRQLGPGRLYSVPVKMRWVDSVLSEEEMNPLELAV